MDELIPLSEASRIIIGHPAMATLHRWHAVGVKGRKLVTTTVGGKRYTTLRDIANFMRRDDGEPVEIKARAPRNPSGPNQLAASATSQ